MYGVCMKMKKRAVGRPKSAEKRIRYNIAMLPSIKIIGAKTAFISNKSFSRYIEDLILADTAKRSA